jgi:DNA invertase Pin-like site-specific DNA recombinase
MVNGKDKMVGYLRTSTDDQILSIDAQKETLARIASSRGCRLVRTYTEHESGGNCDRVELDKAIKHARRVGAVLAVAKLDRLARDQQFLMRLFDGNVPVLFDDLPEVDGSAASRFMVQLMASVAEFERRRTGERMRDWHRARRAKGLPPAFGDNLTPEARARGTLKAAQNRVERAIDEMSDVYAVASHKRAKGLTLQAIANDLNAEGYVTRQGGSWSPAQVRRVLARGEGKA